MAARGMKSKQIIIDKLMEVFPGAFQFDKELRIPIEEDGEEVQIKVTLTAAKVNVAHGHIEESDSPSLAAPIVDSSLVEPTDEEKERLESLIKTLF